MDFILDHTHTHTVLLPYNIKTELRGFNTYTDTMHKLSVTTHVHSHKYIINELKDTERSQI